MAQTRWAWVRRVAGLLLGAALLVAAGAMAWQGVDLAALGEAPPWLGSLLGAAAAANLVITGVLFWSITRSFDASPPVPMGRMIALICVSALLNYLPLVRAGLVGRAAFLKLRHALPLSQSMVILLVVLALAAVVLTVMGTTLALLPDPWRWPVALVALTALAALAPTVARRLLRRQAEQAWLWVLLRGADLLLAGARLWLAFQILGQPIGYSEAVVAGAASLGVKLIGLTPNGLGLSEWAVAALMPWIAPVESATGAAAALVDRAVEVLVVTVTGLASVGMLKK